METENNHTIRPDWSKILFIALGGVIFIVLCLWKWWLAVLYFLIICYGFKRITYSIFFILFAIMTMLGLASLLL